MIINLEDELARGYLIESEDHLLAAERGLLAMQKAGAESQEEELHLVFRAVHSVKGGADFCGLKKICELAHGMEDVLALIRACQLAGSPEQIRTLLRANDKLLALTQNAAASNDADISAELADLAGVGETALAAATSRASLRMLLVEDDFASRLLLQSFLSRYGECHIAVNGREAVAAFCSALERGENYQLVCMDIMMPEMDGREAVQHLRHAESACGIRSTIGAKIIMTTAVDDLKSISQCFTDLCDAYLVKPIDLGKLHGLMKQYALV